MGSRYRTVPLGRGPQFVGLNDGFSLGLEQAPPSRNRLDALSIGAIQNRILISPPLLRLKDRLAGKPLPLLDWQIAQGFKGPKTFLPLLTDFEAATLTAIQADPRPEELADIAAIDGFFSPSEKVKRLRKDADLYSRPLTLRVCREKKPLEPVGWGSRDEDRSVNLEGYILNAITYTPPEPRQREGSPDAWKKPGEFPSTTSEDPADLADLLAIKSSDFYCGKPAEFPNILKYWGSAGTSYAAITGVSADQTWGAAKIQVANAVTMINVVSAFPMPPPIGTYPLTFWTMLGGEIRDLIFSGVLIDPVAVDFWVTGAVLINYSAMIDHIEKDLKKKAKKAKRQALVKMIGLAVVSIVALIVLPEAISAVAGALQAAYQTYADIEARKKAAKQFKDASILFEKDASGFSDKLDAYANMLDAQEAAEVAAAGPTPEMQAALDEIPAPTDDLFAVGGIAAAGIAAFFLLR